MHERTFRKAVAAAGLNPYLCEIANLREQCSWVHSDRAQATIKAIDMIRSVVARVQRNTPLTPIQVPLTRRALVIGGGIAGIQAALDIAEGGVETILVERANSLGGHMAQLSETFPTLDCSQCIMTPRMVEAATHPRIRLEVYSEIEKVEGYVGNFQVTIRRKARYVDWTKCTGCGTCWQKCPQKKLPSEFDEKLGLRTAIGIPFPQAVPNKPVVDKANCTKFKTGKCGVCAKLCPTGAIDYQQQDELTTENVGAIVVATGYQVLGKEHLPAYADGDHPDVITGLQFEPPGVGIGTHCRRNPPPFRRPAAADRGVPPVCRLARSGQGALLLQQDLLHVYRQARHALSPTKFTAATPSSSAWMCELPAKPTTSSTAAPSSRTA